MLFTAISALLKLAKLLFPTWCLLKFHGDVLVQGTFNSCEREMVVACSRVIPAALSHRKAISELVNITPYIQFVNCGSRQDHGSSKLIWFWPDNMGKNIAKCRTLFAGYTWSFLRIWVRAAYFLPKSNSRDELARLDSVVNRAGVPENMVQTK